MKWMKYLFIFLLGENKNWRTRRNMERMRKKLNCSWKKKRRRKMVSSLTSILRVNFGPFRRWMVYGHFHTGRKWIRNRSLLKWWLLLFTLFNFNSIVVWFTQRRGNIIALKVAKRWVTNPETTDKGEGGLTMAGREFAPVSKPVADISEPDWPAKKLISPAFICYKMNFVVWQVVNTSFWYKKTVTPYLF